MSFSILFDTIPEDLLVPLRLVENRPLTNLQAVIDRLNTKIFVVNNSQNMSLVEDNENTKIRTYGESEYITPFDDMLVCETHCYYFCSYTLLIILNKAQYVGGVITLTNRKGDVLYSEGESAPNVLLMGPNIICTSSPIEKGSMTILSATVLVPRYTSMFNGDFLMIRFTDSNFMYTMTHAIATKHPESIFGRKLNFNDSNVLFLKECKYDDFDVILKAINGNLRAYNENRQLMDFLGIMYCCPIGNLFLTEFEANVDIMKDVLYKRSAQIDEFLATTKKLDCFFAKSYPEYVTMKLLFKNFLKVKPIQVLYCSYYDHANNLDYDQLLNVSILDGIPIYMSMIFGTEAYYYSGDNVGINSESDQHSNYILDSPSLHCEEFRHKRLMELLNRLNSPRFSSLKELPITCVRGDEHNYIENHISICTVAIKELASKKYVYDDEFNMKEAFPKTEYFDVKDELASISNLFRAKFDTDTKKLKRFLGKRTGTAAQTNECEGYNKTDDRDKRYFTMKFESHFGFLICN